MRPAIVYKSEEDRGRYWQTRFGESMPELDFHLWPETGNPEAVEYLVAWQPPTRLGETFPNLKVVFSIGAGVDHFDLAEFPPHLKLVRMLDPGIAQGMVEYLTLAVLAAHRNLPAYIARQRQREWQPLPWVPAQHRRVGVMGLGFIGSAVARQLQSLGFAINGWSRSRHAVEGVDCYAGRGELPDFLAATDILVCLLPLTADTRHILNAKLFAQLPEGASIVNAGRGGHLVEEDLIAALDSGQLSSAVLDVAQAEPPGPDHAFWTHPGIVMTPHIAGVTSHESGCRALMENIRRHRRGEAMAGEVDLNRGY